MTPAKDDVLTSSIKQVAKGAVITFIGMLTGRALVFLAKLMIGKKLGPDTFGLFNIGFSFMMILTYVTLGGMNEGVPRFISRYRAKGDPSKIREVLFTSTALTFMAAILVGSAVFASSDYIAVTYFHDERLGPVLRLTTLAFPLFCFARIFLGCLRGFKAMKAMVISRNFVGDTGLIVALLVVSAFSFSLLGSLACFMVKYALMILVSVFVLVRYYLKPIYRAEVSHSSRLSWPLIRFSIPLTGALGLEMAKQHMETILLGNLSSPQNVGFFGAALLIASLFLILGACFRTILLPVISEMFVHGVYDEIGQLYKSIVKWTALALTPVLMAVLFFPDLVISSSFGAAFTEASFVLQILCIAYFFSAWAGNWVVVTYGLGKTKINLLIRVAGVVLGLALNLTLIPLIGLKGAGIAHASSLLLMDILGIGVTCRYLKGAIPLKALVSMTGVSFALFWLCCAIRGMLPPTSFSFFGIRLLILGVIALNYIILLKVVKVDSEDRVILGMIRRKLHANG